MLVEALALDDRRREAVDLFTELLDRASPWGLYAEEMDPKTGEHLGNYPQALTHAAVVRGLCEGGISRSPRQAQATRLAIRSKRESPDKD